MSSKAITERQQERPGDERGLGRASDVGPSVVRDDDAGLPRVLGMLGAALVIIGGMALAFNTYRPGGVRVGASLSMVILAFGLAGLLFHAALDRDIQFRRMYMVFGLLTLVIGSVLVIVTHTGRWGDKYIWAVPCLGLALLFLLAFLRNESEPAVRNVAEMALGIAGGVFVLVGLVGGSIRGEFLLPHGFLLAVFGIIFVSAFVGGRGVSDDRAYMSAVGLGVAGVAVVLVTLVRSLFFAEGGYFFSYGAVLLVLGLSYTFTGASLCSDTTLFVLVRRELGAFFYSPLAYLTLVGLVLVSWFCYVDFLEESILRSGPAGPPFTEPIIRHFFFRIFPVLTLIVVVPLLTMRLLSEEHRTGTLEVLLTAPVDEITIVFAKYLTALISFIVMWLPTVLLLACLPLLGGGAFDYRPVLSFGLALLIMGSGFVSAGLFFSSLTTNQIASGVLTVAFMMLMTFAEWAAGFASQNSGWQTFFKHMSYLDVWRQALDGVLIPRFLLFYISLTILFLFLTVKVLESRKWR